MVSSSKSRTVLFQYAWCRFVQPSIGSPQAPIQAVETVEPNRG